MGRMRKVMLTLLAVAAFVMVTAGFANMLKGRFGPPETGISRQQEMLAYPRAVSELPEPEETEENLPPLEMEETVPETSQTVPETSATVPAEIIPETTEPKQGFDAVPLYYMTDYPDIRFRTGTLASSGSNVAALSMVASYLTGYEYRPDDLAEFFADYIGNHIQWLEYASEQLQLPWEKAVDFRAAKNALEEGKLVITLLGEKSIFTQSQHFIVLTGVDEAGRILVHDPYEPHYTQWNLKDGLANGFEDASIITGYHGSWIYDPAAMPEKPFRYEMAENTDTFRYPGVELTEEEKDMMARLICMEAQSEPFEGQQAIAEVILNRLVAGNFQSSIKSIIHAEGQFKSASRLYAAEPTHIQYEAIDRALNGPYVLPIDVVFFAAYQVNNNVWGTIGAHTFCYQW